MEIVSTATGSETFLDFLAEPGDRFLAAPHLGPWCDEDDEDDEDDDEEDDDEDGGPGGPPTTDGGDC